MVISKTAHWITLGSAAATPTGVLDSEQASIIDEKADDARPGTGPIRTITNACTDETGADPVTGASAYDLNPATSGCVIKFEL